MDKKRGQGKGKYSLLTKVLILGLVVWLGNTYINQALMMKDLRAQKLEEEEKIVELKRDIKDLEKEMDTIDSLEFVEKVAREEYKMVKPREIIYVDKNKKDSNKNFLNIGSK